MKHKPELSVKKETGFETQTSYLWKRNMIQNRNQLSVKKKHDSKHKPVISEKETGFETQTRVISKKEIGFEIQLY